MSGLSDPDRIALPRHIQGGLEYLPHRKQYRLWLHTNDFVLGTFLLLQSDGGITRVTVREDEGDEICVVRPPDEKGTEDGTE